MSDSIHKRSQWKSYERVLSFICRTQKPKTILEWGPGHSSQVILNNCDSDCSVLSVEHNHKYFMEAADRFSKNGNIELSCRSISLRGGQSAGYVTYPVLRSINCHGKEKPEYDLVFVDGRYRYDCMIAARSILKPEGVLVLHDSDRPSYAPAMSSYAYLRHFPEHRTSVMSNGNNLSFLEGLVNEPLPNSIFDPTTTINEITERIQSRERFSFVRISPEETAHLKDRGPVGREIQSCLCIENPDFLIGLPVKEANEVTIRSFHENTSFHDESAASKALSSDPESIERLAKVIRSRRTVLITDNETTERPKLTRLFGTKYELVLSDGCPRESVNEKLTDIVRATKKAELTVIATSRPMPIILKRLWLNKIRNVQIVDLSDLIRVV